MKLLCSSLILLSATFHHAVSSVIPLHADFAVKERHNVPPRWKEIGSPHPLQMIDLQIGIKQGNFDELERHLHEVSDPDHPRYGKHLSKEEIEELIKPSKETSSLVKEWLSLYGIEPHSYSLSPAGDWISLSLPISSVESLLDTRYSIYEHNDGTRLLRTTEWSLPSYLHDHITTIQPTTAFLRANPKGKPVQEVLASPQLPQISDMVTSNVNAMVPACNFSAVTTNCLRVLYNTFEYVPQRPGLSKIGFTNYLGEVPNRDDAVDFLKRFRSEAQGSALQFQQVSIKGGPIDNGTGLRGFEANLDAETILGLVYPIPVTSYSTGGEPPFKPDNWTTSNTNEPYLSWVNYALSLSATDLPQVISTSYGDDEQTVPKSYATAVCNQFAQLGARGVSLFFSSGDEGVGPNGSCIVNDKYYNTSAFLPAFPASCPYVTAVGGTKEFPEVVAFDDRNGYASGAGFSNYFKRPKWQNKAVKKYLPTIQKKYKGLYNPGGRAYPDLAAQGYRYLVVYNHSIVSLDGTSCSSPTISSVFALINDALIADGRPTLGWLNPWLYKYGHQGFNDVRGGSSIGCDGVGFKAGKGWDVASGWGTPDFQKILKVLGVTH